MGNFEWFLQSISTARKIKQQNLQNYSPTKRFLDFFKYSYLCQLCLINNFFTKPKEKGYGMIYQADIYMGILKII